VRLAAVKAIGDLATNVRRVEGTLSDDRLAPTLIGISRDPDPPLRAAAAMALGAVGGSQAERRLTEMLNDSRAEVRYDVAVTLANVGNPEALETLVDMLEPDQSPALTDIPAAMRDQRQALIHVNGLRAVARLARTNPELSLSSVAPAVDRLIESNVPEVRDNAFAVRQQLRHSTQPQGAAP
jgi:HEAT repeat protein